MGTGTLTLVCLLLATSTSPQDVWPMNQRDFDIPIRTDPSRKAEIREMVLYVSTDQGKTWNKAAVTSPDQPAFQYNAPTDGLYYFSICVVDQQNRQDPADPYQAPVGQKILVDTLRPDVRLTAERRNDEVLVRWDIVEPNPEPASLKLVYRPADNPSSPWVPVPLSAGQSGQTTFRPGMGAVVVRMEVQDKAGNQGSAQQDVAAGQGGSALTTAYTPSGPPRTDYSVVPTSPVTIFPQPARTEVQPVHAGGGSNIVTSSAGQGPQASGMIASTGGVAHPVAAPISSPGVTNVPRGPLPPVQVTNSQRITLDYEVARLGPSGVGSVELYVSRDEGRTWLPGGSEKITAAPEQPGTLPTMRRSLTVEVPDEGTYGFYLVVKNGVGLGKPPPRSGEPPQMRVEVDRTPPQAKLWPLQPDPTRRDALVFIWKAEDKNLGNSPVTLQWARQPGGPWETIGAPELPNTGRYVWQVPAGVPPQVYLRLAVRDMAGNVDFAETRDPQPVDLVEPEVKILRLSGTSPQ